MKITLSGTCDEKDEWVQKLLVSDMHEEIPIQIGDRRFSARVSECGHGFESIMTEPVGSVDSYRIPTGNRTYEIVLYGVII